MFTCCNIIHYSNDFNHFDYTEQMAVEVQGSSGSFDKVRSNCTFVRGHGGNSCVVTSLLVLKLKRCRR